MNLQKLPTERTPTGWSMVDSFIVDIKTGSSEKWHVLQLAAYWQLWKEYQAGSGVIPDFYEEKHQYRIDNRLVPSVSNVLKWIRANDFYLDIVAAKRGTEIHKILEHYDLGNFIFPDEEIFEGFRGYVCAWQKFLTDHDINDNDQDLIEHRMGSRRLWFAGTADRIYKKMIPGGVAACVYLSADGNYKFDPHSAGELEMLFEETFRPLLEAEKIAMEWR